MTRMTYHKSGNIWKSKETLLAYNVAANVELDVETFTFKITDSRNGKTVDEGNAKNKADLLKVVKRQLKAIGINFGEEVRNTSNKQTHEFHLTEEGEDE